MATPASKCLDPSCAAAATRRGLCHAHYQVLWRLVRSHEATWTELIERGVVRGLAVSKARREALRRLAAR